MAKRTKKVGPAGTYGPRYGVKIRRSLGKVARMKSQRYTCPRCHHESVRRVSTGIWECKNCGYKFAGGAYYPFTKESWKKEVKEESI